MRRKVAWGVTGSGDKIGDTLGVIEKVREDHRDIEIEVFLSRSGETVLKYYRLLDKLKDGFEKVQVERNSNSPFLAGRLQLGEFDFLLIAPATSNTVAKIAHGIADTLISNSAAMALKAMIPVYVMPTDFTEGTVVSKLPNGRDLRLKVRREDAQNVEKLAKMDDLHLLERPEEIIQIFDKYYR